MAFNPAGLTIQDATGLFDDVFVKYQYVYSTSDNLADITQHYFDSMAPTVRKGDYFLVTANDGKGIFVVSSATLNSVSITSQIF